jgi:hypothetical protein
MGPRSETEVIRLEIAKEGKSFTHLAASTGACIGDGAKAPLQCGAGWMAGPMSRPRGNPRGAAAHRC